MVWFQVDDGLSDHPKADAAGNAALGLWVRLGAYCAKHMTDGFIRENVPSRYGTQAQLNALVKVGLLKKVRGGWQMHEYLERNRSRKQVEEEREKARERMANVRANKDRTFGGNNADGSPSLAVSSFRTNRSPRRKDAAGSNVTPINTPKCPIHSPQPLPCIGCAADAKAGPA